MTGDKGSSMPAWVSVVGGALGFICVLALFAGAVGLATFTGNLAAVWSPTIGTFVAVLVFLVEFGLLWFACRRVLAWMDVRPARSPRLCLKCGYDLRGLNERHTRVCPECGNPFQDKP